MSRFRLRVLIILLASSAVYAAENRAKTDKLSFAEMQQQAIERLNAELTCVQAAKNQDELRSCRPKPPRGGAFDRQSGDNPPPPPPN